MNKIRFKFLVAIWILLFLAAGTSMCSAKCAIPIHYAMIGISSLMMVKSISKKWIRWVVSLTALAISLKLVFTGYSAEDPAKRAKERILKKMSNTRTNSNDQSVSDDLHSDGSEPSSK